MKRTLFFIIILCACIHPSFASDNSWSEGADINNDGIVDYKDFAIMAKYWLASVPDITWVDINDSGEGMKDPNGNPISHGGFTGEMSKYETTNAQYCQFLNAAKDSNDITVGAYNFVYGAVGSNSGADFEGELYFYTYPYNFDSQITYSGGIFSVRSRDGYDMSNHPVVYVSWYGATAFCNYYSWRLPTEWQWQAVADYDGTYTYGCGTSIDPNKANYWPNNPLGLTSKPYTSPVNHYPSYGYGMNDMAGNVFEWTSSINSGGFCLLRGGCWGYLDGACAVSIRATFGPSGTDDSVGFRVCR
ncbi:MAG: SUMF1/EgtB/PvdO family nonheme iron enzyme [Planctomycetes bacterium]|nr:SUMF1/EgtB/PvdO family nonheme iron enzyme [Planctomycetota bacterium]